MGDPQAGSAHLGPAHAPRMRASSLPRTDCHTNHLDAAPPLASAGLPDGGRGPAITQFIPHHPREARGACGCRPKAAGGPARSPPGRANVPRRCTSIFPAAHDRCAVLPLAPIAHGCGAVLRRASAPAKGGGRPPYDRQKCARRADAECQWEEEEEEVVVVVVGLGAWCTHVGATRGGPARTLPRVSLRAATADQRRAVPPFSGRDCLPWPVKSPLSHCPTPPPLPSFGLSASVSCASDVAAAARRDGDAVPVGPVASG